jgi:hypothetical protein
MSCFVYISILNKACWTDSTSAVVSCRGSNINYSYTQQMLNLTVIKNQDPETQWEIMFKPC